MSAWLVDLVLPPRCVSCAASAQLLCGRCFGSLRRLDGPLCRCCGAPTIWPVERCRECTGRRLAFESARAAVAYEGAAKRLVAAWKEHGVRRASSLAAALVAEVVAAPAATVITHIPSDRDRLLARGHHPAEGLARALGTRWRLPVAPLLVRSGRATRQTGLSLPERTRNAREAFVAVAGVEQGVVLVDDVYTTGATTAAASLALRRAGAEQVTVITFARTVRS